jgi:hypothetical protein
LRFHEHNQRTISDESKPTAGAVRVRPQPTEPTASATPPHGFYPPNPENLERVPHDPRSKPVPPQIAAEAGAHLGGRMMKLTSWSISRGRREDGGLGRGGALPTLLISPTVFRLLVSGFLIALVEVNQRCRGWAGRCLAFAYISCLLPFSRLDDAGCQAKKERSGGFSRRGPSVLLFWQRWSVMLTR